MKAKNKVEAAPGKADLVVREGLILGHPGSDSIAIAGGQIIAHGQFADLKPLVGPQTHLVKLGGRVVAPGLSIRIFIFWRRPRLRLEFPSRDAARSATCSPICESRRERRRPETGCARSDATRR